jgi:hypothetical protein
LSLIRVKIKVALAHPAASNGVCSRHRSKEGIKKNNRKKEKKAVKEETGRENEE